jgi:hypothetical protein
MKTLGMAVSRIDEQDTHSKWCLGKLFWTRETQTKFGYSELEREQD